MPFFQDLEIIRNSVNSRNTRGDFKRGGGRTSGNSQYNVNTLQFPLDIGSADKGHYLMFNVNAQQRTQFSTNDDWSTDPTVIANMKKLQEQRGGSTNILNNKFNDVAGTLISSLATNDMVTKTVETLTSPFPNEVGKFFGTVQEIFGNL